jgi:hypothetical protein
MKLIHVEGSLLKARVYGLIDSGADYSTFPVEWAPELGIELKGCLAHQGGTAGGPAGRYLHEPGIYVSILGRKLHLGACFAPKCPIVLLGREDFFRYFRVAFDQAQETFRVEAVADWEAAEKAVDHSIELYAERVRKHLDELEEIRQLEEEVAANGPD